MTRHLFAVVNSAFSWDSEVFLSDDSIAEINFWANNVDSLNGRVFIGGRNRYRSELVSPMLPIQPVARLSSPTPNWFFSRIGPLRRNCRVLLGDKLRSFVSPCMEGFAGVLSNARVIWYSDNQNVESILLNGSR